MESIKDKVAIIGMGCTEFGERWDKGPYELIVESCFEAFEDAGIEAKDIQAAWFASLVSGSTGSRLSNALKLEYIPITRVENFCSGGLHALANACYAVASGTCDIALACGVEKLKDRATGFGIAGPEPIDSSKVMPETPPANMFAEIAIRYFHDRGWDIEEGKRILAQVSVKSHHNGTLSPKAHLRREITVEDVLKAPMLIHPLGLYDCCGISDGSAAAIVVRADMAKDFRDDYVLVKAFGFNSGAGQATLQDDYDFLHIQENIEAANFAYRQAGIKNPRKEIDLAQVHDCFSIHELMLYEELGFSPKGKAREDVEAGTFALDGDLPVNTDGGLKCFGHPLSASGLRMTYEIYKQLQDKAGPRQVKNCRLGLAHNAGGVIGSLNAAVSIYGRRD
ncbi:putative acetyl-CoA acetyltransferase [delta proteobacterium NaphS2]|nr:putative acetyl-CoA acetyltransferase [delta proteobacterium NaphS2]